MGPVGTVVVVGSVNMDFSVRVDRLPRAGETLLGGTVRRSGGGKGANQAVAAARAGGARTAMVGRVGADPEGDALRTALESDGIDCAALATSAAESTGTALITVDASGENTIVVAAGANEEVTVDALTASVVERADVVLAQLEIPQRAVLAAARARRAGAVFVLNAAPYAVIDPVLLDEVDLLVVNEHEALGLTGAGSVEAATASLLGRVPAVLVTLGAAGARLVRRGAAPVDVPASPVEVVDTTGAGDTFCGVLGAALARGDDDLTALQLASSAASIAVQHRGAQDAVPSAAQTRERARHAYGTGGADRG